MRQVAQRHGQRVVIRSGERRDEVTYAVTSRGARRGGRWSDSRGPWMASCSPTFYQLAMSHPGTPGLSAPVLVACPRTARRDPNLTYEALSMSLSSLTITTRMLEWPYGADNKPRDTDTL